MTEHTPEPWSVETAECSDGDIGWLEWCVTSPAGPICSEVFTEANAHLIATAPRMFEFVREVALFSNDAGLCRRANDLYRGLTGHDAELRA